jgi:hypothetical protein
LWAAVPPSAQSDNASQTDQGQTDQADGQTNSGAAASSDVDQGLQMQVKRDWPD